jgi:hypothetical protein
MLAPTRSSTVLHDRAITAYTKIFGLFIQRQISKRFDPLYFKDLNMGGIGPVDEGLPCARLQYSWACIIRPQVRSLKK